MKPEEKNALVTFVTVGAITSGIAVMLGTPVAMAIAIYGTYKTTRGVYQSTKYNNQNKP